jgi:hypothetical protein
VYIALAAIISALLFNPLLLMAESSETEDPAPITTQEILDNIEEIESVYKNKSGKVPENRIDALFGEVSKYIEGLYIDGMVKSYGLSSSSIYFVNANGTTIVYNINIVQEDNVYPEGTLLSNVKSLDGLRSAVNRDLYVLEKEIIDGPIPVIGVYIIR